MALRLPEKSGGEEHDGHGTDEGKADPAMPDAAFAHEKSGRRGEERDGPEDDVQDGHHRWELGSLVLLAAAGHVGQGWCERDPREEKDHD